MSETSRQVEAHYDELMDSVMIRLTPNEIVDSKSITIKDINFEIDLDKDGQITVISIENFSEFLKQNAD